jgi:Uma2 family endonuclease
MELEGTPDWVLEVVSQSSVAKDTKWLRESYHKAGIPE